MSADRAAAVPHEHQVLAPHPEESADLALFAKLGLQPGQLHLRDIPVELAPMFYPARTFVLLQQWLSWAGQSSAGSSGLQRGSRPVWYGLHQSRPADGSGHPSRRRETGWLGCQYCCHRVSPACPMPGTNSFPESGRVHDREDCPAAQHRDSTASLTRKCAIDLPCHAR